MVSENFILQVSGKCVFFSNWLYIKTQSKTLSSRDLAQVVRSWVGVLGGSRFESNWDKKKHKNKNYLSKNNNYNNKIKANHSCKVHCIILWKHPHKILYFFMMHLSCIIQIINCYIIDLTLISHKDLLWT